MPDAEIEAMGEVADALSDLEEDSRGRVLRWAVERYGVTVAPARDRGGKGYTGRGGSGDVDENFDEDQGDEQSGGNGGGGGSRDFEHFAELYDAAGPATDAEKVLVASYWAQVVKGKSAFGSRELNKELKDLGHAVPAINKAMISNMKKKPALILQVSRGGGSPQAQKKSKVSDAGEKWVEARLG
jgi:hypothetical protein